MSTNKPIDDLIEHLKGKTPYDKTGTLKLWEALKSLSNSAATAERIKELLESNGIKIFSPRAGSGSGGGGLAVNVGVSSTIVVGQTCSGNSYDPAFYGNLTVREYMTIYDQVSCSQLLGLFTDKVNTLRGTGEDRHRIVSTRHGTSKPLLPISIEVGDQGSSPSFYVKSNGNVGLFNNTANQDFTARKTKAGAIFEFMIGNGSAAASSDMDLTISVGLDTASGAPAGDPYTYYNIYNVGGWTLGVDNSDSDKFKFDWITGATKNPGTNTALTINTSKQIGIQSTSPETWLDIRGAYNAKGQIYINPTADHAGIVINTDANKEAGIEFDNAGSVLWLYHKPASQTYLRWRSFSGGSLGMILETTGLLTVDGNLALKSGTSFTGTLDHAITANRIWTLQDAAGTIYQTSGVDVAVADGGTGLSTTPSNGNLLIGNGSGYTLAGLTGTVNQITVTNGAGSITLSLPQDLATSSTPTFGSLTLTNQITIGGDLDHNGSNIGFFGTAPAALTSAYTQTYATATRTHSNPTSSDLSGITSSTTGSALAEPSGAYTQSEMQQNFRRIQDQYNNLRADVLNIKQLVNQVLDDLQLYGLLQ